MPRRAVGGVVLFPLLELVVEQVEAIDDLFFERSIGLLDGNPTRALNVAVEAGLTGHI